MVCQQVFPFKERYRLKDSPTLLLLVTGSLLGLNFPIGKLVNQASVSPVAWSWLIAVGAGSILLSGHLLTGHKVSFKRSYVQYSFVLSVFAIVVPNILIFTVIPKLGSGFTGILFTLSPVFTLTFSSLWQVRMPGWLGVAGIAIGFTGAVMVTLTRGEVSQPASLLWIIAGLCIPLSLAVGNIYRTLAWPADASPMELAIGNNFAAAIILSAILMFSSQTSGLFDLWSIKEVALLQVLAAAAMFSFFFRLQQVGGPTYLSQIAYVAAGVALFAGTLFFGEQYSLVTWTGAAVIAVGIALSVIAQSRQPA